MDFATKQLYGHEIMQLLESKEAEYWEHEREKRSIALFHKVSKRVPAYKDFLKKNKIDPEKIKSWQDLSLRQLRVLLASLFIS